ncbi:putative WRKY transcription factor 33 [Dorcoceras hygrometricum]|uniref:Putative WRKY transcription factor 33 n=1 Tax=Dorcoceras hygrometricum TaxID=472368 RepID=A0A2Z7D366_9LAMI|nr:putative WRKY transcription factor 33 [Dorcoceras hygrometricum]
MKSANRFHQQDLSTATLTSSTLHKHAMLTSSNMLPDFTTRSLNSNAYVSHTTTTHAADVMKSANRFHQQDLSTATLTSSTLHKHAMLTSSNMLPDFTTRSLNSNAYVSHTTTTHAADVMKSANRFHPHSKISKFPELFQIRFATRKCNPKHSK